MRSTVSTFSSLLSNHIPPPIISNATNSRYSLEKSVLCKSTVQILGIDIHFESSFSIPPEKNSIKELEDGKRLINLSRQHRSLESFVLIFPILSVAISNLVPYESCFSRKFSDWKISVSCIHCATYDDPLAVYRLVILGVHKQTLLPVTSPARILVGTESCIPILDCISPELNIVKNALCSLDSQQGKHLKISRE